MLGHLMENSVGISLVDALRYRYYGVALKTFRVLVAHMLFCKNIVAILRVHSKCLIRAFEFKGGTVKG